MKHTLHPFYDAGEEDNPLLTIACENGYNYVIGVEDVEVIMDLLRRYHEAGEHDGVIPSGDPRIFHHVDDWLKVTITSRKIEEDYGISRQAVNKAIKSGKLPARKSGATWLIRRADAEARWGHKKDDANG